MYNEFECYVMFELFFSSTVRGPRKKIVINESLLLNLFKHFFLFVHRIYIISTFIFMINTVFTFV